MTEEEKAKTWNLAKRIGRDGKLALLLNPPEEVRESEESLGTQDELL